MKSITIEFTEKETKELKNLIKELDSYYDHDEEFENHIKEWNFEDVDAQREIALDIARILRYKF